MLHWSAVALCATVWLSCTLFGLYILAYYAGALADGEMEKWNGMLPRIYEAHTPMATIAIAIHFAAGGIVLALGCVQLIGSLRQRYPLLHRWCGRVYVSGALLAAIGGLGFIFVKGTIGGAVMDIGFGLYGVLMAVAAVLTFTYARTHQLDRHREWALRLFALAIGSWLYRMDYGFWFLLADRAGHTKQFDGPFDQVMVFFFYIPNLLVVEAFIRARDASVPPARRFAASLVLALATGFLLLGTFFFTTHAWGPAIIGRLTGA